MNKVYFLSFFLVLSILFFGCEKTQTKKQNLPSTASVVSSPPDLIEKYYQVLDSVIFFNYKKYDFVSSTENTKMFFVKKWNTPDYFYLDGQNYFAGVQFDGKMFKGVSKGKYVYYLEVYKGRSNKWKDSSIVIERKFPCSGVSSDPRSTCWWISAIYDVVNAPSEKVSVDTFLYEALGTLIGEGEDKKDFMFFLNNIKKNILNTNGQDEREKIINFTKASLGGNPQKWDAFRYPGYYKNL